MEFVETPIFTEAALDLLPEEHCRKLQAHLTEYPDDGVPIQGSRGLRIIRWVFKKQGKRGGVRVIYYWVVNRETIYMIYIYSKSAQNDVSREQLRTRRKLVQEELL
jgi:mRNA-degrading endonuclease RelE of RelBE toxin-antitoxin system